MKSFKIQQSITPREDRSLEQYLEEVKKIPQISPEQEVELAVRIRDGDEAALHALVNANLLFVVSVAKRYLTEAKRRKFTLNDLINFGNLGLIKAAQRFDETRGFKFISYAVWWIRQTIIISLYEKGKIIRMPVSHKLLGYKIQEAEKLLQQDGFPIDAIDDALIADTAGVKPDDIRNYRLVGNPHMSLNSPVSDDGDEREHVDCIQDTDAQQPDAALSAQHDMQMLSRILDRLPLEDRELIKDRFGLEGRFPRSIESLADREGLTTQAIRARINEIRKKLRKPYFKKALQRYRTR